MADKLEIIEVYMDFVSMRSIRKYHELMNILIEQKVLLPPSYNCAKAQHYSFLLMIGCRCYH
jgi:hypothetical protein